MYHCVDKLIWINWWNFYGLILDTRREIKVSVKACAWLLQKVSNRYNTGAQAARHNLVWLGHNSSVTDKLVGDEFV